MSTDKGIPGSTGHNGDAASSIKAEEVVCIVKRPDVPGEYEVFSLEVSEDQAAPFKLSQSYATDLPRSLLDAFLVHGLPEYLQSSLSRRVHVLVSTRAGTGLASKFYESVLRPLLGSLGLSAQDGSASSEPEAGSPNPGCYNLVRTQDAESVRGFARKLSDGSTDGGEGTTKHTVVLLSGDGGIVEMLNGKAPVDDAAAETPLPLIAMLPLGTGNALFNSLHKTVETPVGSAAPTVLVQALRTLLKGKAAPLPSFKATFPDGSRTITYKETNAASSDAATGVEEQTDSVSHLYGAIVASYGFHSQLVWESDTPEYRKHGDKRFGMVAQELLKESHAYRATVEICSNNDGSSPRKLDREQHAYILATMVSNLEKTFCISPASRPLDGRLRLVHFGPVGGERTMDIMMRAYDDGKHVDMSWTGVDSAEERVGYDEVTEVRITTLEEDARWRKYTRRETWANDRRDALAADLVLRVAFAGAKYRHASARACVGDNTCDLCAALQAIQLETWDPPHEFAQNAGDQIVAIPAGALLKHGLKLRRWDLEC
ncbi:Uu.00g010440.m01.CDS01 [Anthostomella pinea]|uniref:Uu.00g010440.m01.CDS01 n=1 Tax=Anthostomella pinea TaxID=933095 RepID=A0AAI8VY69_9PEZI|nr:Uu.00g010440.m01.CDS01 [Anthostomella pinea]